ncbi:ABC transporter permease [Clostridium akagii]|uniref:ABC transporter permease n=1 Tax=Clostridium akagii TaxID=91623 RepID=UPI00047DADF2|nr:ABC transporter permease [Clostridium akagii]
MTVFIYNAKRILKLKKSIISLLILPIIVPILIVYVHFSWTTAKIAIIDYDKTEVTFGLTKSLSENYRIIHIDENSIEDDLGSGKIQYALVLDKGLTNEIITGKKLAINSYFDKDSNVYSVINDEVNNYLKNVINVAVRAKKNKNNFYSILKNLPEQNYKTNVIEVGNKKKSYIEGSLDFLIMFMLLSSISFGSAILTDKEKMKNIRTFAAPITLTSYMFQCLLVLFVLQLVQVTVLFITLFIMYREIIMPYILSLYLLFIFFSVTTVSIGLCANSVNSSRKGLLTSIIVIPMCMLGGCFWDNQMMPSTFQYISNFIPITWMVKAISLVTSGEGKINTAIINIIVISFFSVVFFLIGIFTKKDIVD